MEFRKQSKDILCLAAPMMMGNILQQLYNTFDVAKRRPQDVQWTSALCRPKRQRSPRKLYKTV